MSTVIETPAPATTAADPVAAEEQMRDTIEAGGHPAPAVSEPSERPKRSRKAAAAPVEFRNEIELLHIPIAMLMDSPTNPRQHFDKTRLDELTASVKQHGIKYPLRGRRLPDGRIEIVAGHRRKRAAAAAGLTTVPVNVGAMTDDEVRATQLIELLTSADVHPMDQALALKRMRDAGDDVPTIRAKVGAGSNSQIYAMLKLCDLVPTAQKAFLQDRFTAGHAVQIARLQPEQQHAALKVVIPQNATADPTNISVRDLARWIEHNIHLNLNEAPFNVADGLLVEKAGPCTQCPKRTGYNKELFPDIRNTDTCTDPACYQAKVRAHIAEAETEHAQAGTPLVRISAGYSHEHRGKQDGIPAEKWRPFTDGVNPGKKCTAAVNALVTIGGWAHGKDRQAGEIFKVCTDPKCPRHFISSGTSPTAQSGTPDDRAARLRQDRQLQIRAYVRSEIINEIAAKRPRQLATADLLLVAPGLMAMIDGLPEIERRYNLKLSNRFHINDQMKALAALKPADVPAFILELALRTFVGERLYWPKHPEALLAAAKRFKVDTAAIEKRAAAVTKKKKGEAGVCHVCGCTEVTPCEVGPSECSWTDSTQTLCTNPKCIAEAKKEKLAGAAKPLAAAAVKAIKKASKKPEVKKAVARVKAAKKASKPTPKKKGARK